MSFRIAVTSRMGSSISAAKLDLNGNPDAVHGVVLSSAAPLLSSCYCGVQAGKLHQHKNHQGVFDVPESSLARLEPKGLLFVAGRRFCAGRGVRGRG